MMICKQCGEEFEPKKRGRKNTGFCSKKCSDKWYSERKPKYIKFCPECKKIYYSKRKEQKYCGRSCAEDARRTGRKVHRKVCLYCGTEFQTVYPDHKYCTSACASRHAGEQRRGEYFCEYCGKPRQSDHPNRNRFCSRECAIKFRMLQNLPLKLEKEKAARERKDAMAHCLCPECGELFQASTIQQVYCSSACQYKHALKKSHDDYVSNYKPRKFVCEECGMIVITSPNDTRRFFCSEECSEKNWKRIYKRNREKQVRQAFVENVELLEVFERDKGICAICGLPVPAINDPANVWSPTVDHIMPLSIGGDHSYGNCQLSHRLCNSLKGQDVSHGIDWRYKLIAEPGRWNKRLDELWTILGEEIGQSG